MQLTDVKFNNLQNFDLFLVQILFVGFFSNLFHSLHSFTKHIFFLSHTSTTPSLYISYTLSLSSLLTQNSKCT